jgi:hypothetical protein
MKYSTHDTAEAAFLIGMNEACNTIAKSRCVEGPVDKKKLRYDRLAENLFTSGSVSMWDLNLNAIDELIRIR